MVLAAVGCGAPPAPPVVAPPAPPVAASAPATAEAPALPPLTVGPTAQPAAVMQLRLPALFDAVEKRADPRLPPSTFAAFLGVPALDFDRPVTMLRIGNDTRPAVFRIRLLPNVPLALGPEDSELRTRGLEPLKGSACVVEASASPPDTALCGDRSALLTLGRGSVVEAELAPGVVGSWAVDFERGKQVELDDARDEVPRLIDPLLPRAMQGDVETLRLLLMDVGFELLLRKHQLFRTLGPLELEVKAGADEKLEVSAVLVPEPRSLAEESAAALRPTHVPSAFWELSSRTDGALVFDAGLLAKLLSPSLRGLALAAEAKGKSSLIDQLGALPEACLAPGRSVVWAVGQDRARRSTPAWPPVTARSPRSSSRSHTLVAIEDERGRCSKAVTTLLDDYLRLLAVAESAPEKRFLQSLPTKKPLPKSVRLFSLGWGDDATYLALATHKSALWLLRSPDLSHLELTLTELVVPGPAQKRLKSRPELARLATTGVLATGFWRDDEAPFSQKSEGSRPRLDGGDPPLDDAQVRRVPLTLVRDTRGLRFSAELEVPSVRRLVARELSGFFGSGESWVLAKLPEPTRAAALRVLEAACRLEHAASCNRLGLVYGEGRGVLKDSARGTAFLERACELRSGVACANLAGFGGRTEVDELALFQKSCDLESPLGCAWLGVRKLALKKSDTRLALTQLQAGCEGFIGFACGHLGAHYAEGTGLPQDDEKAADFYERSCQLGYGSGCIGWSGALREGKGRKRDAAEALAALKDACRFDRQDGCFALGVAYLRGLGGPKDENAAKQQLGVACDANHAEACRVLADLTGEP
jgi:TPR repeat protein